MFKTGLSREIEDNDIYAVTNSLRSDRNTEEFAKLWNSELEKEKPSLMRVILRTHGVKIFTTELLYSISEVLAR